MPGRENRAAGGEEAASRGNFSATESFEQGIPISTSSKVLDRTLNCQNFWFRSLCYSAIVAFITAHLIGLFLWVMPPCPSAFLHVGGISWHIGFFLRTLSDWSSSPINLNTPFWQQCSSLRHRFKRGRQPHN